jgi:hypothetical protein
MQCNFLCSIVGNTFVQFVYYSTSQNRKEVKTKWFSKEELKVKLKLFHVEWIPVTAPWPMLGFGCGIRRPDMEDS